MIAEPSGISGSAFCTVNSIPFTLMPKIEFVEFLGDFAERCIFRHASIEIVEIRHVALQGFYILADVLGGRSQFRLAPSGYENVGALVDKTLRRRQTNATAAASDKRGLSIELAHVRLSLEAMRPLPNLGFASDFITKNAVVE
jgi:hypothetical protein